MHMLPQRSFHNKSGPSPIFKNNGKPQRHVYGIHLLPQTGLFIIRVVHRQFPKTGETTSSCIWPQRSFYNKGGPSLNFEKQGKQHRRVHGMHLLPQRSCHNKGGPSPMFKNKGNNIVMYMACICCHNCIFILRVDHRTFSNTGKTTSSRIWHA